MSEIYVTICPCDILVEVCHNAHSYEHCILTLCWIFSSFTITLLCLVVVGQVIVCEFLKYSFSYIRRFPLFQELCSIICLFNEPCCMPEEDDMKFLKSIQTGRTTFPLLANITG